VITLTANLPGRGPGNRRAPVAAPVRRVLIVAATHVECERYRMAHGLTREEAVPVCTPADAVRAARLYRGFTNRTVIVLSPPAARGRVLAELAAAGIRPADDQAAAS
jgi:hypothetical protein